MRGSGSNSDSVKAVKKVRLPLAVAWAAVLCAVLLAQASVRAQRPNGIDLTSYLLSADALRHGGSPYVLPTPFPYLYPATLALLLIPLTFVPATVAVLVWFALSVAAAVWSMRAVVLNARPGLAARSADVALFLAVFFTFFFTVAQSNLRNGQVNFIVLALCVGAGLLFCTGAGAPPPPRAFADASPRIPMSSARHGRRRFSLFHPALPAFPAYPAFPAVSWSLAVALKLVPLVLLPFFALRWNWRWLALSALLIAAWCLLPAIFVGWRIVDIYEQYWRVILATSLASRAQPLDFSLAGTIAWITGAPLTPMLEASAAAVVLGWIIAVDGRRLRTSSVAQGDTRAFALYSLAIPLVSPQSEVHHLAFMLPAAAVVGAAVWCDWQHVDRALQISAPIAAALYLAATATPIAAGPLFCASLIAFGVALMNVSPRAVVVSGFGRTESP